MSQVVFEYTDDAGQARRVPSAQDVPKKFQSRMTAIGLDESAAVAAPAPGGSGLRQLESIDPRIPVALVAAVVWYKSDNFLMKAAIAVFAGGYLFLQGYDTLMKSDYAKTDAQIQSERGTRQNSFP